MNSNSAYSLGNLHISQQDGRLEETDEKRW